MFSAIAVCFSWCICWFLLISGMCVCLLYNRAPLVRPWRHFLLWASSWEDFVGTHVLLRMVNLRLFYTRGVFPIWDQEMCLHGLGIYTNFPMNPVAACWASVLLFGSLSLTLFLCLINSSLCYKVISDLFFTCSIKNAS